MSDPAKLDFLSKIVNVQWGGVYAYIEAQAAGISGLGVPFKASAKAVSGAKPVFSNITVFGDPPEFVAKFVFNVGFSAKPAIQLTLGGESLGDNNLIFNNVNFYLFSKKGHKVAPASDPPFNPAFDNLWEGDFFGFSSFTRPVNKTYSFTVNKIPYLKSDPKGTKSKVQAFWPSNIAYEIIYSSLTNGGPDVRAADFAQGHDPWQAPRIGQPPATV